MDGVNSNQLLALIAGPQDLVNGQGHIEVVNQARNALDAVQLIQLGVRATLVCQLTGLTRKVVNNLYPLLTGTQSPSGQAPFTDTWYLKSNRCMLHANVVWRLYRQIDQIGHSTARVLINAYVIYMQIMDAPVLTLTRAFFVPRLIAINAWYEQRCDHCAITYIGPLARVGAPVRLAPRISDAVAEAVELPSNIAGPADGRQSVTDAMKSRSTARKPSQGGINDRLKAR